MVRIKDIAKHAHVSSATVSRVLNKDKTLSVSDDTRQKVLQIAREFNIKHIKKDVVRISLVAIKHRKKLELLLAEHLKKKQMILTMYRYAMELRKNAGIKGFLILNY